MARRRERKRNGTLGALGAFLHPGVQTIHVVDEDVRPWAELAERRNVYITGIIEDDMAGRIQQVVHWMDLRSEETIRIWINSPGGDLFSGIQLFDTIRGLKSRTETIVLGLGASMAAILLQAGTRRLVGPTSQIMLHELQGGGDGSTSKVEDDVQLMRRLEDRFVDILSQRSRMSKKEIRKIWHRRDAWFGAEEAVKSRLADGIYGRDR